MWSKTEGHRAVLVGLGFTLVVATVLRAIALDHGLWFDEIVTLVLSARHSLAHIVTTFTGVNTHPLYSVLAHWAIETFGESAWALRLPAAVFGVASVAMVYVFAASVLPKIEALVAAAVIATSYHHVWFSQNARGYTLMGFLALYSTHYLIKASRTGRPWHYALYAAAAAAGVYTHLTMAFVVAGHALAVVIGHLLGWSAARQIPLRPVMFAWIGVGLITAVAYTPFVPGMVDLMGQPRTQQAAEVATLSWLIAEAIRSLLAGTGVAAALMGGALAAIGAASMLRRWPLVFSLLMSPAVVTGLALVALRQPIRPRFFFFLSAAAAVFVGRGIGAIADWAEARRNATAGTGDGGTGGRRDGGTGGRRDGGTGGPRDGGKWVTVGLAGTLVLLSAAALPTAYRVPKQDFAGAASFLANEEAAGTTIVATGPACFPFQAYYGKPWRCLETVDDWRQLQAIPGRVLVATTLTDYIADAALRKAIKERCANIRTFPATLAGGQIGVCAPESASRAAGS
jgi:hypothetical protein